MFKPNSHTKPASRIASNSNSSERGFLNEYRDLRDQPVPPEPARALRSFTLDAAYAAHAETLTGSLEEGKLADLVVLSRDIMGASPPEVLTTTVRMTLVAGEVVYERQVQ